MSLLDLHVDPAGSNNCPPALEILEAGTGHGALTLYLARAIHAANPPQDDTSTSNPRGAEDVHQGRDDANNKDPATDVEKPPMKIRSSYEHGQDRRQAIIHTIDISPKYSEHAKEIIKGFRQAMYANDVEFHVGDGF